LRIDTHAHVAPPEYERALPFPIPVPSPLDGLRAFMDRYSIDRAVISTGPPGAPSPELARLANDALAEIVRGEPDTFAALAALPLGDPAAAVAEAARAHDELGLDGVLLLSNAGGTYLGDPSLEPLFAELDRRKTYAFLHPTMPPHDLPLGHPVWLYEFVFETTRALANLIYSGTLERHPNVRLQVAHLGGTAPFIAHRLASLAAREPEKAGAAPAGAVEYLGRLFYDTGLANNRPALAATLEVAPLDHVVFGSDWPYLDLPDGVDPAPGLDGLAGDRAAVDATNATALVDRWSGD
jgi:predicted TIM-barrel fold metal-dependent hydrolase